MMPPIPPIRGPFRTDLRARAAYSEGAGVYRIIPGAVAVPVDEADLRALLGWAVDGRQSTGSRQSLVLRGAGSAMGGGNVGEGILVDLTAMPKHLAIDVGARTAVTSAGVTLGEIAQAAEPHGLRLPPDPSSARWATVGGVFSTDAAGPRTLRYGSMRRWVLGATILTADGERLDLRRGEPAGDTTATRRFASAVLPAVVGATATIRERFPRVRKNSSGYALDAWLASGDLLDLFIGAEGTLGVVTEVTWRLDPIPAFRAALQVEILELDRIAPVIEALTASGPSVCELLDRSFLDVVRAGTTDTDMAVPDAEAVLLLEYEDESAAALEAAVTRGEQAAATMGARALRPRSQSDEAAMWALRHAASPILARLPATQRSMQVVEDGCVPVKCLAEYLHLLRDAAARRDLPIVLFGHAGDGHVHANLLPDTTRPGWSDAVASLLAEVSAGVSALGGTPAGEHGDGRLRAGLMDLFYGTEVTRLFHLVKDCFDPLGILNPGVILPAVPDASPLSSLKVGAEAAPIPDDIALALRTIEREGGYARSRLLVADDSLPTHDSRLPTSL
jgi:FAD/FMN-containing dehydrogenase